MRMTDACAYPTGAALTQGTQPFTVHGHRLSSLYRAQNQTAKPFIVLKILINFDLVSWGNGAIASICGTMKSREAF